MPPPVFIIIAKRGNHMLINVNVLDQFIRGEDGKSPYIGENGNWFIYNDDTGEWEDSGISPSAGGGIKDCIVNPDFTITFVFNDGTSYTTPSIKGADAKQIVYCIWDDRSLIPEGYDEDGIYREASQIIVPMTTDYFPEGYPNKGDYLMTRGGVYLIVTDRDDNDGDMSYLCYATTLANLNGNPTSSDEFTVQRLYAPTYANIVGLQFTEVVINGVTHLRLE